MTPTTIPDAATIGARIVRDIPEVPRTLSLDEPFDHADIDSLVLAEAAVVATREYGVLVHDWELRTAGTLRRAGELVHARLVAERPQA
ncbi:hypothetical protein [Cellulomonas sp. GbtcB1]|jgi:hypothetical protein|uniref:hypothetical protein n=1 Tax=Cellulomonas sp. GbtcB1 TaxID=2824746 RepID=UPI001C3038E1|nr:hypothetical protein [Cellulomonas sp. GbtcB1]